MILLVAAEDSTPAGASPLAPMHASVATAPIARDPNHGVTKGTIVIYMVDHVYIDPATEPAWNDWYAGNIGHLLTVPGVNSAQRLATTPHRAVLVLERGGTYGDLAGTGGYLYKPITPVLRPKLKDEG